MCFAKLDLMDRRGRPSTSVGSDVPTVPPVLRMLAETFASHILRPQTWTTGDGQEKHQRQRLQEAFMLSFFYFVKRKHNLLTAAERKSMEDSSEEAPTEALDEILFDAVSAAAKLSHAFENAMAIPTVTVAAPTGMLPPPLSLLSGGHLYTMGAVYLLHWSTLLLPLMPVWRAVWLVLLPVACVERLFS